jgi:phage tail protein X
MKFAVSKGEQELSELTARLFEIKGRGAAERAKKAEATLLKANPHLSDLAKVPDGTLIVIPDLPDNPPVRAPQTADIGGISKIPEGTLIVIPDLPDSPPVRAPQTADIGADIDEHLKFALKELSDAIGRSADSEEQIVAATTEALKSRELKDFARQSPELKAQLEQIADAAKNQLKQAKASAAAEKEALAQLQEAMGKLIR